MCVFCGSFLYSISLLLLSDFLSQERVCEESASFDLTSTDIGLCISDIDTILRAKKDEQSFSTEGTYVTT